MCDPSVSSITHGPVTRGSGRPSRTEPSVRGGGQRLRFAAMAAGKTRTAAPTPCSPSGGWPRRARPPPPPCAPGGCALGRDGPAVAKPGQLLPEDAELIVDRGAEFVSRGGIKLANALDALPVEVAGRDCLDVGASTGGFTDCLLQRGAERVIALDVGYGQLDWRLRQDPRVTVMERVNARDLDPAEPALRAEPGHRRRLLHLAGEAARRRSRDRRGAGLRPAGAGQAPVRARARAGRQAAGWSATPPTAATRCARWPWPRARRGWSSAASPRRGCPARRATARPSSGARATAASRSTSRRRWREVGRRETAVARHPHPSRRPLGRRCARRPRPREAAGVELVAPADEHAKHGEAADGIGRVEELPESARTSASCSAATAASSTRCAATPARGVPVFGINFGTSASWPRSSASSSTTGCAARSPATSR